MEGLRRIKPSIQLAILRSEEGNGSRSFCIPVLLRLARDVLADRWAGVNDY
jgi:hypothetical protein